MKKLLAVLLISVGLVVIALSFCCSLFTAIALAGSLLGVSGGIYSVVIFRRKHIPNGLMVVAVFSLIWGVICLSGITAVAIKMSFMSVQKKYISRYYVPNLFKEHFKRENKGVINIDEDWRQTLVDNYSSIVFKSFQVYEGDGSYWAVNALLNGRAIDEIDDDVVLFVEMDTPDKPVVREDDFLSQSWNEGDCRRVMLFGVVQREYCYENGGYKYIDTKTDADCGYLKWE